MLFERGQKSDISIRREEICDPHVSATEMEPQFAQFATQLPCVWLAEKWTAVYQHKDMSSGPDSFAWV